MWLESHHIHLKWKYKNPLPSKALLQILGRSKFEVKIEDASFYTVFPNFLLASNCINDRYLVIFFPEFNFSSGCLEMRTIFSDPYSNVWFSSTSFFILNHFLFTTSPIFFLYWFHHFAVISVILSSWQYPTWSPKF